MIILNSCFQLQIMWVQAFILAIWNCRDIANQMMHHSFHLGNRRGRDWERRDLINFRHMIQSRLRQESRLIAKNLRCLITLLARKLEVFIIIYHKFQLLRELLLMINSLCLKLKSEYKLVKFDYYYIYSYIFIYYFFVNFYFIFSFYLRVF